MGSSACQFRRPISGKHVAAGNGRTFQVAQRHSTCELPNDRDNHCRSGCVIHHLGPTKDPGIGQWSSVCVSRLRKLVPIEWHHAHDLCAISSVV